MGDANTSVTSNSIPRIFSRADFAALNIKARREPSDQKIRLIKSSVEEIQKESDGALRVVISTAARDRDKDTLAPQGWDLGNYLKNPVVLFAHDHHSLPIGRAADTKVVNGALISHPEFVPEDIYAFAGTVSKMVAAGFMKAASVGFNPKTWVFNEDEQGYDFDSQELLEWSFVPVGSNPEALIGAKSAGIDLKPMKAWAEETLDRWQKHNDLYLRKEQIERIYQISGGEKSVTSYDNTILMRDGKPVPQAELKAVSNPGAENRWNLKLSKAFDVRRERLPAATRELDLIARYLDCEVKEITETDAFAGGSRAGAFLTALDECLVAFVVEDIRNITNDRGSAESKEIPPRYETMQLNSKMSGTFLIEGSRFLERVTDSGHIVAKIQPTWSGIALTCYGKTGQPVADEFLKAVQERASQINYLKGEAFSLSGSFLERGDNTWADVFLEAKNERALKRTIDLVNTHGKDMESRGVIMAGPPGTGKTLSARVMMREAKDATFIWVSARDFYYAGAFGGTVDAFDIASECAPAIILFEDIDNWWGDHAIDLLKTELDGLQKNAGVVTVITTNTPERLPKALIDRPGRFHDVLQITLPTQKVRELMLAKWLPEISAEKIADVATATQGYSGAHIRELARFAKIIEQQESLELDKAIDQALEKVKEQRELINQRQMSTYRASPEIAEAFQKSVSDRLAELRVKAMADCPNGESCPYQDGMDSCPAGENCAMKKTAASAIAANQGAQTSTETAGEQPAEQGKQIAELTAAINKLSGILERAPAEINLEIAPPSSDVRRVPGEAATAKTNVRKVVDELNRRNKNPKKLSDLSGVDSTVNTQNFEDRVKRAAQKVVTRLTGQVF